MQTVLAPYISEIQRVFCPDSWVEEDVYGHIWTRNRATGQLEMSSYVTGEKKHYCLKSSKKVFQSYVLRNLSDHSLRAIAVVNEQAEGNIRIDGWNVSLIDSQSQFGLHLRKSVLYNQINDERDIPHFVANIGGGSILTLIEYRVEEGRCGEEEKRVKEGRILRKTKTGNFKYSPTAVEIEHRLPRSAANSLHVASRRQAKVLQVYTLLSQEMKTYGCAIVEQSCDWLDYNSAGYCEYESISPWDTVTSIITVVKEQSALSTRLLGNEEIGVTILIDRTFA